MIKTKNSCKRLLYAFLFILFTTAFNLQSQTKTLGLLKKLNGNDENGYVLFSPIGIDTTYLINKCGQKIHYWATKYTPGFSLYLKPNGNLLKAGTYNDTAFAAAGGRGGMIEEYDWNGNLVWSYKIFNDSLCQHHDIYPMPNGNIMVLAWHALSKNEAIAKGRKPANFGFLPELWGERLIELKPIGTDSADIVWQWDLFDHIIQDFDSSLPNYGNVAMHPELMDINYALTIGTQDWIHANSIDYNPKLNQIVISAHNISEIWIIDHSTDTKEASTHNGGTFDKGGDFLYRWGNPAAYKSGSSSDRKLFRQHNARWIEGGLRDSGSIMIFNNGLNRDTAYSSIDIVRTPILSNGSYVATLPYGPAKASWIYTDSVKTKFYAQFISGAQMLPNGNVLICSGPQGRFFEVTEKMKIVWEYRNPVNSATIRSDGQMPGSNQVFRCTYYPKNYPAFSGKSLNSLGTIERSSYPYSCNYEAIPPKIVALGPKNNDSLVLPTKILTLKFDESVLKRNGIIQLYCNGTPFESINMQSDLVVIRNDSVYIHHTKAFPIESRISVKIPAAIVSDSSNNTYKIGIDSSLWHFNTIHTRPKVLTYFPAHQAVGAKANQVIRMQFNVPVFKKGGNISLFEGGNYRESFAVNSANIRINGNIVEIQSDKVFKSNTLIVVAMDSCFEDSFGIPCSPIAYGDWYFRTSTAIQTSILSPEHLSDEVVQSVSIYMNFNRSYTLDSNKSIRLFSNGVVVKTIALNDTNIHVASNSMRINTGMLFAKGSLIGVEFPSNSLRDTFGFLFGGTDTGTWHFTIEKSSRLSAELLTDGIRIYPIPNAGSFVISSTIDIKTIELLDMQGRTMPFIQNTVEHGHVTIQMLNPSIGIYVLRINGDKSYMLKIE